MTNHAAAEQRETELVVAELTQVTGGAPTEDQRVAQGHHLTANWAHPILGCAQCTAYEGLYR